MGKPVAAETIVYDNLKALINQRYQCIIHVASRSKSVTLKSVDYFIAKSTRKKKKEKKKKSGMNRFTLKNRDEAVACGKVLGDCNARINIRSNSIS